MGRAQLFQTTGVEEQWRAVVAPWLQKEGGRAWRDPRPTVILTPSRAESFYPARPAGAGGNFVPRTPFLDAKRRPPISAR